MASIQVQKGKHKEVTGGKRKMRHCAPDTRLIDNHSNDKIDKTMTPYNFSINGFNCEQSYNAFDDRFNSIEYGRRSTQGKNKRVVMQSINIPVPAALSLNGDLSRLDNLKLFYFKVADILKDVLGEENFIEMFVHVDEIHDYVNAETGEDDTSREHGTAFFVPADKDNKLNAKWFTSRENINKINNAIDKMCQAEFGISFHTGKGSKSKHKSVEQLKAESKVKEAEIKFNNLQTEIIELTEERDRLLGAAADGYKSELESLEKQCQVSKDYHERLRKKSRELEEVNIGLECKRDTLRKECGEREKYLEDTKKEVDIRNFGIENSLNRLQQHEKYYNAFYSKYKDILIKLRDIEQFEGQFLKFVEEQKAKNENWEYKGATEELLQTLRDEGVLDENNNVIEFKPEAASTDGPPKK